MACRPALKGFFEKRKIESETSKDRDSLSSSREDGSKKDRFASSLLRDEGMIELRPRELCTDPMVRLTSNVIFRRRHSVQPEDTLSDPFFHVALRRYLGRLPSRNKSRKRLACAASSLVWHPYLVYQAIRSSCSFVSGDIICHTGRLSDAIDRLMDHY